MQPGRWARSAIARIQRRVPRRAVWPPALAGRGIEIGAHDRPIPGIRPWYVDRAREFAGRKGPADVLAEASVLPFRDSSLDYVATSHVLEHLPDPAGAIVEWYRAVKPGGIIYMIVPDRRLTFDRDRARTPIAHLLEDFERGTTASDATHIDEFFDRVDVREMDPALKGAKEQAAFREEHREAHHRAAREGRDINIHFHVFEQRDVLALLRALAAHPRAMLRHEIVESKSFFPPDAGNGFLVALRSMKTQ
ncbi:MAG TPA: class I SAM-dependent methyltransferase [Myxococcales bacterium]|nr:class I SAM-dependent methyltransferase [Myxococcales bacterium]